MMRAVKQLADVIARLLKLALANPAEAREQLAAACRETLQMELSTLSLVDARAAAELLGRADKVAIFATLLEAQGALDLLEGAVHRARARHLHALAVAHQAQRLDPKSPEVAALLERLRTRLDDASA